MFYPAVIGRVNEEVITFESLTGRPFRIMEVNTEGLGITAELLPTSPGASEPTVCVRQRVTDQGDQTAKVRVRVRDGVGQYREIVIPVHYRGLPQEPGLLPAGGWRLKEQAPQEGGEEDE